MKKIVSLLLALVMIFALPPAGRARLPPPRPPRLPLPQKNPQQSPPLPRKLPLRKSLPLRLTRWWSTPASFWKRTTP